MRPTYVKGIPRRVLMDLVARMVLVWVEVVAEEAAMEAAVAAMEVAVVEVPPSGPGGGLVWRGRISWTCLRRSLSKAITMVVGARVRMGPWRR